MKKKWNRIIAVIALLLCLSACGSKRAAQAAAEPAPQEGSAAFYCGTWTVTGIGAKGVDFTLEQAAAMGLEGADKVTLILASDQKACLALDGSVTNGAWAVTDTGIRLGTTDLSYLDGRIRLEMEKDVFLYFEKQSDNQDMPEVTTAAPTEATAEEVPTEPETVPAAEAPTEPETTTPSGIRPEFKEAMDSYEAFYNEYCDLLAEYTANPTDLTLLTKYAAMITKAEEMDKKFAAWDEGDLTPEELKYYLDVTARVEKKLLDLL